MKFRPDTVSPVLTNELVASIGVNWDDFAMLKTAFTEEYRLLIDALISSREKKGLSQRELAVSLEVPQSVVSKIETRERRIDIVEYIIIASALGTRPEDIGGQITKLAASSVLTSLG